MQTFILGEKARAAGTSLFGFERIDSTNLEALRLADGGQKPPFWVAALEQTAGRGRRGRQWQSQPGNLAATLLLDASFAPADSGFAGFMAALTVRRAISKCAPKLKDRLKLKWPNDVLLDGAKLVGILLERQKFGPAQRDHIAVGMGINIVAAPDGLPYETTCLQAHDATLNAPEIFTALSDSWETYVQIWDGGRGSDQILDAWREAAFGIGKPIRVRLAKEEFSGTFDRLDKDGKLIVRLSDNSFRIVTAGDVFF